MSAELPPRRTPAKPPVAKAKPAFEVVEDCGFEVVEEAPKKPAPKRAQPVETEVIDQTERDLERSKPKKKKKRRINPSELVDPDQEARDRALRDYEWIFPAVLLGIGVILTFVGAFGASKMGALYTLGVMCLGLVISIPLTIAALMVIGIAAGIEYGRVGPAILKLAAITFVVNGIMFIGDWMHLPRFIVFPISCMITFGLFMTQFDLDTWETNASVGALNVLSFIANIIIIGFLIVAASSSSSSGGGNDDDPDDSPPADIRQDKAQRRDKDRGTKFQNPGPANFGNPDPDDE
jgi:hypothetical protein